MIKKIEESIEKAKAIHGDKFTYEAKEGVRVDLRTLSPNQRVCAGGKSWHIVMTEK